MYTEFFKLDKKPFSSSPSAAIFYQSTGAKSCYDKLLDGIRAEQGLVLVTGEEGSGKTLYAQKLQADLKNDHSRRCINLPTTTLSQEKMQEYLCTRLDLSYGQGKNDTASKSFFKFLSYGTNPIKAVVIVIDEAEKLSVDVLSGLTMLVDMGAKTERKVQVVLLVNNEQALQLDRPHLSSLKEKISLSCQIEPFAVAEVAGYIKYQLQEAGAVQTQLFLTEACERIFHYTKGNPRSINLLCNQILTQAAIDYVNVVTPQQVENLIGKINFQSTLDKQPSLISKAMGHNTSDQSDSAAIRQRMTGDNNGEPQPNNWPLQSQDHNMYPLVQSEVPVLAEPFVKDLRKLKWATGIALVAALFIISLLYSQLNNQKESIRGLEDRLVVLNDKLAGDTDLKEGVSKRLETKNLSTNDLAVSDPFVSDLEEPASDFSPIEHPSFDEKHFDKLSINELFSEASRQISENNLTEPEGDNALETYHYILERDPENQQAEQSIVRLKQNFIKWGNESEDKNDLTMALSQYVRAQKIDPEDEKLVATITGLRNRIDSGEKGSSPSDVLKYAWAGDSTELAKLMDGSFSHDVRDKNGNTPLMLASSRGHTGAVEILLANKADVNLVNKNGDTALLRAVTGNHQAIAKLLLGNRADVNATNKYGKTALMSAVTHGHSSLISLLSGAGAAMEQGINDGKTPLAVAVLTGQIDVVSMLLKQGARVDSRDNEGWTPLMLAAGNGFGSIVKILLDNEADKSITNSDGDKAIDLAKKNNHQIIVALLKEKSARKVANKLKRK